MKVLTRNELEARKAQSVRLVRDALGDEEEADDIEDKPLEDYPEHRHIRITNPKGATQMAAPTRRELLDRIEKLETTNEALQSRLDEIADVIGDDDEEDNGEDEFEDGDQGED